MSATRTRNYRFSKEAAELAASEANEMAEAAYIAELQPPPPPAATRSAMRDETAGASPRRERKRKGGGVADRFHVPPEQIPPGMSYEWKRHTLYGKEDMGYSVEMAEQGWEPVPNNRHTGFMPNGYSGPIMRDGLILMERPVELTREAQNEDRDNARMAVKIKEAQMAGTPVGQLDRVGVKVNKTYGVPLGESFEIPG